MRLLGYLLVTLLAATSALAQIAPPPIQFGSPGDAAGPLGPDGRIPSSQMPVDALEYKGAWDAATNTPTLADGAGTVGDTYAVQVGGTQNLGGGSVDYVAGNFVIFNGTVWDQIGSGNAPVPANPTALIGMAAVPGSAQTFMRSDGAPAIDPAIAPTWTGIHTFNGSNGTTTPSIVLGNITPELRFFPSNGTANTRMWRQIVTAGTGSSTLNILGAQDNGNNIGYAFQVTHDGSQVTNSRLIAGSQNIDVGGNQAPGITSNSGSGAWAHTGAFYTNGLLGAGTTPARPGPTNTGTLLVSAPGLADIQFFDASHTADNRTAEWIYFQNKLQARFKNDTGSAAAVPLAFAGGQALGITGIESNSGSGAWTHTGTFALAGSNSTIMVGGSSGAPGQVLTSTGNATTPAWSTPLPAQVASTALINQSADASVGTFYAVPTDGTYRASCYVVLTRAATTSATLPGCTVSYTDLITNVAMTSQVAQSASGNVVGTHLNGSVVLEAKSGTNVGYSTTGYASSGATTMQYRVRIVLERIQ